MNDRAQPDNLITALAFLRGLEYQRRVVINKVLGRRRSWGIYWSRTTHVLMFYRNVSSKQPSTNHFDMEQMFNYMEARDRITARRQDRVRQKD